MKNKSILVFLFLFLIGIIACKKKFDPEEFESKRINTADSLVRIAYSKYESKDFNGAYRLCNEAILSCPGFSRATVLMGKMKLEDEEYSKAIELFTIAINNQGIMQHYEVEEVYQKRAFAKESLNDYRGALADYNILTESFNSKYAYYHRGILKYNFLDDANGACSDWSVAGEKGDNRAYDLIDKFCNN
ncbi:hypothetical protein E0I26_13945 [Flavobacterium rhamnosiphilum]|uniref:Tetratricopeptide repeat-containing protein n=1 Tax=Flavobacterium rhamnosiphilum TaxID=2541724 RepID=A0A4V2Z933_9FLAO|nr:hypothetical protein [Flavobacterium rhamnosiphilum]TDE42250.1 hypothetical protein E0I26_13945 [Flavobacterium rhamnosiphilum]